MWMAYFQGMILQNLRKQINVFATIFAEKLVDVWKPWIADLNFLLEIDGFQGSFSGKSMAESLSSPI